MKLFALMIGINDYPTLNHDFQLKGCINDQKLLRQVLLERFDFEQQNIEWLMNGDATRANILNALDRLAGMGQYEGHSLVEYGDFVVISYSGYGSRLYDEYGDDQPTIVPVDSDRLQPIGQGGLNLDITNEEILARVEQIKERTSNLLLYFDSSHSTSIGRDLTGGSARSLPADDRYDDIKRVVASFGGASLLALDEEPTIMIERSGWLPLDDQYVVVSASAHDENAYEYHDLESGETFGALTYHFVREMTSATADLRYHDVFHRTVASVNLLFTSQYPQLEGNYETLWSKIAEFVNESSVIVVERLDDHRVKLAAGVARGTTTCSQWQILSALNEPLAEVTIRSVGGLSSEAVSADPLPDTVDESCHAVEVKHYLGNLRVPIAVERVEGMDHITVKKLRDRIRYSSLLTLAPEGPVDMMALLLAPRSKEELANPDPTQAIYAPELGALDVATWVIVGRDGHLMPAPLYTINDPDAVEKILTNLEKRAGYINTHRLRPVGIDPLRNKLNMSLSYESDDGYIEELPIDEESGLPLIENGDVIRIHLENNFSRPLYYVVYSMDAIGNINRLWPPYDLQEPIDAYDNYPMEATFTVPDELPEALNGARETLKVMVTPEHVEFKSALEGPSMWNVNEASAWFEAANHGRQNMLVVQLSPKIDYDTWTVEQIDYYIER